MPKLISSVPIYRHHRASGQAVVTLCGRDIYLGPYKSAVSRHEYDRVVGEWQANGRRLAIVNDPGSSLTVTELIAGFWDHATTYYRKPDGTPTSEINVYKRLLRLLRQVYGRTLVADFGPRSLRALQSEMIRLGWVRTSINCQINRVRHVFKWGTSNELVEPSIYHGLLSVSGLKAGRTEACESPGVHPVSEDVVEATLAQASPIIAAMIQLQLLTGMRPGEVCSMRGCDLDLTSDLWVYRPATHKTQHHGHERIVLFGPRARRILESFLKPDRQAYLFSPIEAESWRRAWAHARRRSNVSGCHISSWLIA